MSRSVFGERIWVTARSKRSAAYVPFAGAHGRRGIQTLAAIQLAYGLVVFDIATGSGVVLCRLPRAGTSTVWCCCSERSNRVILSSAPWEY